MAKTLYNGGKQKFSVNLSGIGNKSIYEPDVDFTLCFYTEEHNKSTDPRINVTKAQCTIDGDSAVFILSVNLPVGKMVCFATVKYNDEVTKEQIIDPVEVKLDTIYTIAEMPITPGENQQTPKSKSGTV